MTHFYPCEFGGNIEREPLINEWYSRDKLLTRARFRAKSKEVSSFKYTYLCGRSLCLGLAVHLGFGLDSEIFFTFRSMEIRRTCGLISTMHE